jgi:hypothetical protein
MKNFNLLKSVLIALCLLAITPSFSNDFLQENNPWTQKSIPSDIDNSSNTILGYYTLDFAKLKSILATSGEVKFPFRNGNLELFKITKTGSVSPDLQLKYPEIGTYNGTIEGIQTIDFSINTFGLLGKVKIDGKTYTLKPLGDSNYILILLKTKTPPIDDDVQINQSGTSTTTSKSSTSSKTADLGAPSTITSLKIYKLAVAPTAEYSNHFIDLYKAQNASLAQKKEIVISAIAQTIATVNSITLVDLGIKFELVSSNDKLIEFDTANDNFTHGDKMALLGQVSSVINSKIGINSYNLGHVFDASYFGGVANLYVLCKSNKANGVSGSGDPEGGDYFPGVVAHEIGHQMGAEHTFNSNVGVLTNRVETGSGVTIMGYGNMELFYHAQSIDEMNSYIKNTTCASVQTNSNTAPSYLIPPTSTIYTIPAGTPFVLGQNLSFTDTQNNSLSYNWDQMDAVATSNPPLATSDRGPAFISIYPNEELVRYYPKLETVLSGSTSNTWEVVPQVSREMNFALNVRETNSIAPILVQEKFKVKTINDGTGPFIVTSQGVTGLKYKQGDEVMVSWNESSSKSFAIDTENVKISLSYDGGLTFSHVLKESTPNDGAERVLIPILANASSARIKVEPVGNIYYAINMVNFEITNPQFVFNKNTPDPIRCFGDQNSSITVDPSGGGGAPYTISWFKKNGLTFEPVTDSDTNPKTLINKGIGIYKVRVTDKDAIQYEQEIEIIGPANPLLVSNITANTIPVMCYGDKTGQFSLQVSGGSAPYKYIMNGVEVALNRGDANLDTDNYSISNLAAGSYSVKIIDANSCQSETISIIINGPSSALSLTDSKITNTTSNSNGAISVTITGGTATYTYSWTGPNNYTSTTQNIGSLANGIYKLRVTDKNNCVLESNFTIETIETFNYNITQNNVSCKAGNNGELGTYPSGGNGAPYSVIWRGPNSFFSTNFKINNLVSGNYELTITDQLGESFPVKNITITEPLNTLALTSASLINVSCVGDSSGSFGLNTTGGTSPYSYFFNGNFIKTSGSYGINSDVFTKENLGAGTYTVNIKDDSGCAANNQVVITEPLNRIEISSFVITPVSIKDAPDGSISIEASGGFFSNLNGTYTYNWRGPNSFTSTSKNISGLKPGNYTVVVTNSNNCISTDRTFILDNPALFAFNITPINTTCSGNALGSISANPRGGYGAPYVVNWFKYNGTEYVVTNDGILDGNDLVLSKIGKGVYKIVITDSKGISYSQDNIEITEPAVMDLQLSLDSIQPETCFGLKNGAFSVTISGGSVPYDYVLNDTKIFTNSNNLQAITGLGFGDYILTIKDKNTCVSNSLPIYVPGPEEIIITNYSEAVTNIKCFNTSSGAISINVKGGANSGYDFSWTGPSGFTSASEGLSGLSSPGNYHLKITDATYTSCSKEFDFVLIKPAQLQATISSTTNNVCFEPPYTGGFSISITGGTLPYVVNGDLFNSSPVYFSEKATGDHTVTVNDANSCNAISFNPEVTGPSSAIQITNKVAVNNHCDASTSDPDNASLSFDLSEGDPFYNNLGKYYKVSLTGKAADPIPSRDFYIDTSTNRASVLFENLKDDEYTVTIIQKDPNVAEQNYGCRKEFEYKLSKTVYWLNQTVQNVSCASTDNSGKIEFKGIYGGTPFVDNTGQKYYEYIIIKPDNTPLTINQEVIQEVIQGGNLSINNLPQGAYKIQFIDYNSGCVNETGFKISIPEPHTSKLISQTESCFEGSNGTATIKITGGVAPYIVSIIDTTTNSIKSISPSFGVFGEEYPLGATQVIEGLSAGTYTITVKDYNSCLTPFTEEVQINKFNAFSQSLDKEDVTCFGAKNGKVTLTLNGGSQPLSVELFNDTNSYKVAEFLSDNGSGGIRPLIFDNLPVGNYTLTVKDQNSKCIDYKEENIIISEPSKVVITALNTDIKNISCYDKSDGSIKIAVTGGGYTDSTSLSYNYVWKKNGAVIPDLTNTTILTGLAEGVYTVSVTPVVGDIIKTTCAVEQTYSITKPEQLYLIEEVNQHLDVYCNGNNTGVYKIYFSGGTAPYTVLSDNGQIAREIFNNEYTRTGLSASTYQIDIQDASGCKFSEGYKSEIVPQVAYGTLPITIRQPDAKLSFKEIITPITCKEEASTNFGSIEVNVSGGTPPYSITWSWPIGYRVIGNNPQSGVFKIAGPAGSYKYTVIDAANNCGATPGGNPEIKEPTQLIITEQLKTNSTQFNKPDGHYKFIIAGNVNTATFYDYVTTTNWYKIVNNVEEKQIQYPNGRFEASDLSVGSYVIRTTTTHKAISTTKEYSPLIPGGTRSTDTILPGIICSTYKNFEITQPALLTVTEDISAHLNVKCRGTQTGVIKLNISGGTAPYEVRWTLNGATTGSKTKQGNSVVIDQLSAGDYTIDVIDHFGNNYSTTINPNNTTAFGVLPVSISEPTLDRKLFFNKLYTTLTDTSCGIKNGAIVLNDGATVIDNLSTYKPLNYFWSGPEGWTSNDRDIKNLASGFYNLTIIDQNDCSISTDTPFEIKPSAKVVFDAPEFVILNCKNSTDPAVISLSNITGTEVNRQKIEWSKLNNTSGLYETIDNSTTFDNRTLTVTKLGTYKVIVSTLTPSCNSLEKLIKVVDRGFNLKDQSGKLIDEKTNNIKGEKPLCYNEIGSLRFIIEKVEPKPATTFEFYLDNSLVNLESKSLIKYEDGYKLINLSVGMHSLKVKDDFSCESIINFEIENQQEIRLTSSIVEEYIRQKIQCLDEFGTDPKNKAVIDVTDKILGGVGKYRYKWTGPSSFSSANAKIEVARPGVYNLVVLDDNNCKSQSYAFTIIDPKAISITESYHKNQSCINETGSIGASISGGTPPYSIKWYNENAVVLGENFEIKDLQLGKVTAEVTDSNQCNFKQEFEIINERLIIPKDPVPDKSVCIGKSGFIMVKVTKKNDGSLKFYYNNVEVNSIRDTQELYRVIIDNPILGGEFKILNSYGCSKSYTYQFGIAVPKLDIMNSDNKTLGLTDRISENETVIFNNNSVGTFVREILDFGDGSEIVKINRGDSDLEKRKHAYTASGVYTSKIELFNEMECSVFENRPVFVGKAYQLKLPSSFSPNLRKDGVPERDNLNDYFRPIFNGFKSGKMIIYNASGIKLYEESFSNPEFKDTLEFDSWKGWGGENASLENKTYFCFFEGVTFENLTITESTNFYLFK